MATSPLVLFSSAGAQIAVWDGGGGSSSWGTAQNWNPNSIPSSGADVAFGGSVETSVRLDQNRTVGSLTFYSNASPFTISRRTLTINGSLTNNSVFEQNISSILALGSSITVNASSGAIRLSARVSGTNRGITKTGASDLILSGSTSNTFTGALTVNEGGVVLAKSAGVAANGTGALIIGDESGAADSASVRLLASNQITDTSAVTIRTDGLLNLQSFSETIASLTMTGGSVAGSGTLGLGGTLAFTGSGSASAAISSDLALNSASRVIDVADTSAANDLAISGVISDGSVTGSSVSKTGAGNLLLSEANTFTGGLTLSAGTLTLANNNAVGAGNLTLGSAAIQASGGSITLANALSLAGDTTFGGTEALIFTGDAALTGTRSLTVNNPTTFSGIISGANGLSIAAGSTGALTLSGSAANTYTGNTTVNGGTLVLAKTSGNAIAGGLVIGDGSGVDTVQLGSSNQIADASAVSIRSSGVLNLNNNSETVGSLAVTGGASVATGTGALTLNGDVSHDGVGSSSATLAGNLNLGGAVRTFTVGDSAAANDLVVSAAIADGALTKAGAGTLAVSGLNTYAGNTTVSAGTLSASSANTLSAASTHNVASGATLALNGNHQSIGGLAGAGSVTLGGATLSTGANNANSTFTGVVSGNGSLSKSGSGTLTIGSAQTFNGTLAVDAGTLILSGASGTALGATAAEINSGATLWLDNRSGNQANRVANTAAVTLSGGTLRFSSATGGSSETVGALNAGPGLSSILVEQSGAGAAVLTFSSLGTIDDTAAVNFTATGGTLGASSTAPQIYIGGLSSGFIGGWATVGSDFAEYSTFGVRALTGYYTGADGINVGNSTANILLTSVSASTAYTLSNNGTTVAGSLLVSDIPSIDLGNSTTRYLNLASGGLLKTTSTNTTLSGLGRLTAGNTSAGTLVATVQSTGVLTIDNVIVNNAGADGIYGNGAGRDGIVKLTKAGPGELVLNGANTHTGGTQLDAGTLTLGNDAAAGGGTLTLGSATLRASGGNRTLSNPLVLAGNTLFAGNNTLTLNGDATLSGARSITTETNVTFAGAISGATGSLAKSGNGTLTLSGATANTYAGTTTVNAGEVRLAKTSGNAIAGNLVIGDGITAATVRLLASNQTADTSAVTVSSSGTLDLNGNSDAVGSLTVSGGASVTTGAGVLTLNGNVAHTGTGASSATIAGNLNLGGATRTFSVADSSAAADLVVSAAISNGGITKTGAGTLRLDSANTYAGPTTVSAGTLSANATNALGANSAVDVASGATLALNNFSQTLGSLGGAGSIQAGNATLSIGGGNSTGSYSGVLSGSGALTKTGAGTQTLSGANTYTGSTTVSAGTLVAASNGALGTTAAGTTVSSGATLGLSGGAAIGAEALTLNGSGVGGAGALQNVSGTNSFAGAITLAGNTVIGSSAGTLTLSGGVYLATYEVTFAGAGNTAVTGAVTNAAGDVVKNGNGTVTFSGANTYIGTTTINAGTLVAANSSALGTTAAGTIVNSGGTLALSGGISIGAESLSLAGSGASGTGALRNLSGVNSFAGPITLAADSTITSAAGSLSLTGTLAAGGYAITVNGPGNLSIGSTISGATSLAKTGSGTLAFAANQSFGGELTLGGGTLSLQNVSVNVTTLRVTAASILDFSGVSTLTVGTLILELPGGDDLSITNWQDFSDFFYVSNFLNATYDQTGQPPTSSIVFANFTGDDTRWKYSNNEITPVPEPSSFGVLSLAGLAGWFRLRRRRRS